MEAKHPPRANPNRGYSYVGQENVATISGYEKGLNPGTTRDMKVNEITKMSDNVTDNCQGNSRHGCTT